MTNIEQFTRELMLAHDIDYWTALSRAEEFYKMMDTDRPEVLNGWIDFDKKLPKVGQRIMVYSPKHPIHIGIFREHLEGSDFTHWQQLPKPPKEK